MTSPDAPGRPEPEDVPAAPIRNDPARSDDRTTVRRAANATAARLSGGLAGAAPDPDGASPGRRTFTPDFLTELFRNPLDPGYADAAARKAIEGDRTGAARWSTRGV